MTLQVGDPVRLRPDVSFGPLISLRLTRVFQNGMAEARNEDDTTWVKARLVDFQHENTLSPNFMDEYKQYLERTWATESAQAHRMHPNYFSNDYKVDMIQAYPHISQTPFPGYKHPFFTHEVLTECFARILNSKNLHRTHEMYLEERWGQ